MSWTKQDNARLRELHTAQKTVSEIADEMKKDKSLIRSKLVDMGYLPIEKKQPAESEFTRSFKPVEINQRRAKITPEIEKKICELREQCFSFGQIGYKVGLSAATVRNVLIRNGYPTGNGKYHKEDTAAQRETVMDAEIITETKEDKPMKAASINEEFDKAVDQMIAEAKEKEPASLADNASSEKQDITPVIPLINDNIPKEKSQPPVLTGIKMMMEIEAMLGEVFGRDAEIIDINANGDHCDIGFTYHGREYSMLFAEREEVPDYGNDKH